MGTLDEVALIIRVMPSGEEADVEMPLSSTGKDLIAALMDADLLPAGVAYELLCKEVGANIADNQTLADIGVGSGHTIIVSPRIIAGAMLDM